VRDDGTVTVAYLHDAGTARLWHHLPLDLSRGEPVRLSEGFGGVLELRGRWFCVEVLHGIGRVPEPDNLATGIAQPLRP